jgi:hypothetical protein
MRQQRFHTSAAFTLLETVMALSLMSLLAGALYAATHAAIEATKTNLEDQAWNEKNEAFVRATRRAFLAMPGNARLSLRYETGIGAATPEVVFADSGSYFGIPAVGGQIILTAPAQSDGTRTFGVLRVPKEELSRRSDKWQWFPLMANVEKVEWAFLMGEDWKSEWTPEMERPKLVRLRFTSVDGPGALQEHFFWLPDVERLAPTTRVPQTNDSPPVEVNPP